MIGPILLYYIAWIRLVHVISHYLFTMKSMNE